MIGQNHSGNHYKLFLTTVIGYRVLNNNSFYRNTRFLSSIFRFLNYLRYWLIMPVFKRTLTPNELIKEKKKDYRNVVLAQVVIVVTGLMLSEFLVPGDTTAVSKAATAVMSGFAAFYAFMLWDILRDFTNRLWLIQLVFIVIAIVVIMGLITEFPYYKILAVHDRRLYLFVLHAVIFIVEVIVISYAVIDVFSGKTLTSEKLWGAACVYLMIGISFASLYDIMNFIFPGCLGKTLELGLPSYAECIYHSFSMLGSGDSAYDQPIRIVRNIGTIEVVWGNLFAMLIIGKLLTLPRATVEE